MPGARSYGLRLVALEGDYRWEGQSEVPELSLPASATLPAGGRFKALLSATPTDLLPPGGVSVSFETDSYARMLWHRLRWARPWILLLGLAGLVLVALPAGRRRA